MANDLTEYYKPGSDLTVKATAAITGKRFVKVSGNRTSGPGLSDTTEGSVYRAAHADAGGRILGVSKHDIADTKLGTVVCAPGNIVPVLADGAIAAMQEVEVGTAGKAKALEAGEPVGLCMTAALDATDAEIKLY